MIGRESEPATTPWDHDDDPHQDTLALLQEEIARLEAELRARDEAPPHPEAAHGVDAAAIVELQRRVDGLLAELAARDETVEILLEQTRLYEEAAEAQRLEWEQLHRWVDEVERRVDVGNTDGPRLRAELEAEREGAARLRLAAESDRRDWEAHRVGLEREAQILRSEVARHRLGADPRDEPALLELAAENRRLRTEAEALRATAAEAGELGRRLAAALADLDQARRGLLQREDELRRERIEREAEAVALRSQLAGDLLRQVEPAEAPPDAPERPSATDADERIRAFRQHLKDLHEDEAARRADRSLASRLSRLWRHTGPG